MRWASFFVFWIHWFARYISCFLNPPFIALLHCFFVFAYYSDGMISSPAFLISSWIFSICKLINALS